MKVCEWEVCEQRGGGSGPCQTVPDRTASLSRFLQTAIRPNQSSCSALESSNCTNQLRLAAPQPAQGRAEHTLGSGHHSKVQSEIITLILLELLERRQQRLAILHMETARLGQICTNHLLVCGKCHIILPGLFLRGSCCVYCT